MFEFSQRTLYTNPIPLDPRSHKKLSLEKDVGYGFAKHLQAVPVNFSEIRELARHYPIVFIPDDDPMPFVVLGLRQQENLFVDREGKWLPPYSAVIPSYIKHYPFSVSKELGSDKLVLCVEEECLHETDENRLFDESGNPAMLTQNAFKLCTAYEDEAEKTKWLFRLLDKYSLFYDEKRSLVTTQGDIEVSGYAVVDEKELDELKDSIFLEIREKGLLPIIYAHLLSGFHWAQLASLVEPNN